MTIYIIQRCVGWEGCYHADSKAYTSRPLAEQAMADFILAEAERYMGGDPEGDAAVAHARTLPLSELTDWYEQHEPETFIISEYELVGDICQ